MVHKKVKVGLGFILAVVFVYVFALSSVVYADTSDELIDDLSVEKLSEETVIETEETPSEDVDAPVGEALPSEEEQAPQGREGQLVEEEITNQVESSITLDEANELEKDLLTLDKEENGWKNQAGKWYYYKDGQKLSDGWFWLADFQGKHSWERLNIRGEAIDQIFEEDGRIYYSQAGPLKGYYTGWLYDNGYWYYYRDSGSRVTDWQYIKGVWYYFRSTGTMIEDEWAWLPIKNGSKFVWKYFNKDGANVVQYFRSGDNRWLSQVGPHDGYVEGWYEANGFTYYFRKGSGTAAQGWQFIDDHWYYIRQSGTRVEGGWGFIPLINNQGSAWKFFEDDGKSEEMLYHEAGYSYLSVAGPYEGYLRGWDTDELGNTSFYRLHSGTRVTDWQFIDGYWRYFTVNGAMMRNAEFFIGGVKYYADDFGIVWQNDKVITSDQLNYSAEPVESLDRISITLQADGSYRYDYVNPATGMTVEFDPETNVFKDGHLLVLDMSSYQRPKDMDLDEISKQIDGVILRVGFTGWGTGESLYYDDHFDYYYEEFTKRGVPVGGYWYSCADTPAEAIKEANFMIEKLNGKQFALPIYWDTEDAYHQQKLSAKELTKVGQAFLDTLEQAGYYAGLYASSSWLRNELNMEDLETEVWVAHYGVSKPNYSGDYGMWQYTSEGNLDGHDGPLDLNYMYKNYMRIIQLLGLNGFNLPL